MSSALTDDVRADLAFSLGPDSAARPKAFNEPAVPGSVDAEPVCADARFRQIPLDFSDQVRAHDGTLHALACSASRTKHRAHAYACAAVQFRMSEHTWKTRIEAAIKANWTDQGHSMRELSARLGKGPNYVSQMLGDDKAPRVDFVIDLAQILGISASQVLLGVEMTADDEKLLMLASKLDPDRKRSLLDLLNSLASSEGSVP